MELVNTKVLTLPTRELGPHLELGVITGITRQITDETGIPLKSDRVPELAEGIDFEYIACPFADSPSRMQLDLPPEERIPISNLERRRLKQSYPRIKRLVLSMRDAYTQEFDVDPEQPLNVEEATRIMASLSALPIYLTQRYRRPVDATGALPQYIVVGSNGGSGAVGALNGFRFNSWALPTPSGEEAQAKVESENRLVSQKTGCAASPHQITDLFRVLAHGNPKVTRGDIEEETDGLVLPSEFRLILGMGQVVDKLEAADYPMQVAEAIFLTQIGQHKKKHNPRRMNVAVESYRYSIAELANVAQEQSVMANHVLGRVAYDPGEFTNVVSRNVFRLHGIREARAKGVNIPDISAEPLAS